MITPPEVRNHNDATPELAFLENWRRIFEVHERLVLARRFSAKYNACWRNDRRLLFTLDSHQDEIAWETIHSTVGQALEIRAASTQPRQASSDDGRQEPSTPKPTPIGCIVGILTNVSADREQLEVLLDEATEQLIESKQYYIPQPGLISYTAGGIPPPSKYLGKNIAALKRGKAANPDLGRLLVEPAAGGLPSPKNSIRLVREDLLLPFLNNDQIKAVEGVFNAPGLFLIQASPGNERSSAIAEICHQMGLRGKRVLLTSSSGQAVDASLSFLVQHPSLRPLRLEQTGVAQDEHIASLENRQVAAQPQDDSNGHEIDSVQTQTGPEDTSQRIDIQTWIANLPESVFNQLGESIQLKEELDQTAQLLNHIDREFLYNANTLARYQDLYLYLEKILGNLTQPIFSDAAWNFKKQEADLDTDLIRSHPTLLELKQGIGTLSNQLTDWADITVIRFEGDAPFTIYSLFRQADQLSKHHTRISRQARELLKWLHTLEPEIQGYFTVKGQYAQITLQRQQIYQVIQECENVIEQSQTEIPRLKDLVQEYGSLYMKLKESQAALREWLEGVIKQSLDPEFVPLPWVLDSAKCDDVWPTAWNTYKPPDFQSLFEMYQRDSKNAVRCRILSRELSALADQLTQYTTPEALEEIGQPKINWSVGWVKDLIEFDVRGDVLPRQDAEDNLREMGRSLLINLQDPEWRQEKFQEDENKLQRQVAHRISQLKEIARLVDQSMYKLEEDCIHFDEHIQAQLNVAVVELQATAMRITSQLGNQKYQELNNLQKQSDRAVQRLAEMQVRMREIEDRHTDYMQVTYNFHDALETSFLEAAMLFPALQIKKTLKEIENTEATIWAENWRSQLSAFENKLQHLDAIAAQLQPVETLQKILSDLDNQITTYGATQSQLGDKIRALGRALNQINAAYQENQEQLQSAGQDWQQMIDRANLVGAPLALVSSPHFSRLFQDFDCIIIDGANWVTPPELLPAMLKGKKIALAGDQRPHPLRLGAFLVSDLVQELDLEDSERKELEKPLFQTLYEKCPLELRQALT
ncbi:MAG: hypothetical protein JXA78_17100 [Anaerolineales bacterium]|nr:hypothetical protein [Anaerolineales bacterium]